MSLSLSFHPQYYQGTSCLDFQIHKELLSWPRPAHPSDVVSGSVFTWRRGHTRGNFNAARSIVCFMGQHDEALHGPLRSLVSSLGNPSTFDKGSGSQGLSLLAKKVFVDGGNPPSFGCWPKSPTQAPCTYPTYRAIHGLNM